MTETAIPSTPSPAPHLAAARSAPTVGLNHSGVSVARFIWLHVMGMSFPIAAGLLLYGWRAFGVIAAVVTSTVLAAMIWRGIGVRGRRIRLDVVVWLALLLSLTLPPHLFGHVDLSGGSKAVPWPILPGAGIVLAILIWLLGGGSSGRIHAVLVAHLLIVVMFQDMLVPHFTLHREHAFWGDVLQAPSPPPKTSPASIDQTQEIALAIDQSKQAWISAEPEKSDYQAVRAVPASLRMESFTGGHEAPQHSWVSLESLVRDRLPPLEDLIVGGQPAPIGQGSAVAIIIGGLFLLYRGLIDFRVPLLIFISAMICFIILPVPVVITDSARIWRWMALRDSSVGWALGITFANYEMMASPLLFTAFYLASSPAIRPLVRRARMLYAILIGIVAAAFQLYVSVTIGPYLALLAVSLLAPSLDQIFKPRALV